MNDISIFVAGDVVNYHQKDGTVLSEELADIVIKSDYAICNFEAPIFGYGKPTLKSGSHHSQRRETLQGLKQQGFDLLLFANNHIMDYGLEGLQATLDYSRKAGLDTLGAGPNFFEAYKPLIKQIGDIRIGMINAGEAQFGVLDHFSGQDEPGYAWINHDEIDRMVVEIKSKCDYIILFVHAGLENYTIPQKEWRIRYKLLCDAGVDVVVGSHPHVPQGYEKHNSSLIFYSLGNLYFDSKNYISKSDSTYSVILRLCQHRKKIDFDLVYHCKNRSKTRLSTEYEKVDVSSLNKCLADNHTYTTLLNEMSSKAYEGIKANLEFSLSSCWHFRGMKSRLKNLLKRVIYSAAPRDKDTLQLHLLRNEAYYYAARHALELKYREKVNRR